MHDKIEKKIKAKAERMAKAKQDREQRREATLKVLRDQAEKAARKGL